MFCFARLSAVLSLFISLLLTGCGGGSGGGGSASVNSESATIKPFKGQFYSGSQISLLDATGKAVGLTSGGLVGSSGDGSIGYDATVKYPLVVEVKGSYYNEITGGKETSTSGLRGIILSKSSIKSAIPVTPITETAVAILLNRTGLLSASNPVTVDNAVTSLHMAHLMTGVPASAAPNFDPSTQKSADANTLRIAALSASANNEAGSSLLDKVKSVSNKLATLAPSAAPSSVINQLNFDTALTNVTSGQLSILANGAIAPTNSTISTDTYDRLITESLALTNGTWGSNCDADPLLSPCQYSIESWFAGTMAVDDKYLYVSLKNAIKRYDIATGISLYVAGTYNVAGTLDGIGSSARINRIISMAIYGADLYFVDKNLNSYPVIYLIRKMNLVTGQVTTLSIANIMDVVQAMAIKGTDLYLAGTAATIGVVQRIALPTGTVNLTVQTGQAASGVQVLSGGIAIDGVNLYLVDLSDSFRILKINLVNSAVTILAGAPLSCTSLCDNLTDGTGTNARFSSSVGGGSIFSVGNYLYVVAGDGRVRIIDTTTAAVTTQTEPNGSLSSVSIMRAFKPPYYYYGGGYPSEIHRGTFTNNRFNETGFSALTKTPAQKEQDLQQWAIIQANKPPFCPAGYKEGLFNCKAPDGTYCLPSLCPVLPPTTTTPIPSGSGGGAAACATQTYVGGINDPQFDSNCQLAQFDACLHTATGATTYDAEGRMACSAVNGLIQATQSTWSCRYCPYPY